VAIAHATPANGLRVGRFIVLMGPAIGSLRMWPLAGLIDGFGWCEAMLSEMSAPVECLHNLGNI
jgi:hypothetical protein